MTTKKIYGPWIKWHGGECPVPPETMVEVKYRNGVVEPGGLAEGYYWPHEGDNADIVKYRTFTEEPDLEAAEKLLLNYGYTVVAPTKPLTFEDVVPMVEVPPDGTAYWAVATGTESGVYETRANDRALDHLAVKRRMAYLDKEHALIAARHIFGLKGGEL